MTTAPLKRFPQLGAVARAERRFGMASARGIRKHWGKLKDLLDDERGRFQTPIRRMCSHWRNSSLKPLSATWNVEMTQRSICLPDLPARSHTDRYSRRVWSLETNRSRSADSIKTSSFSRAASHAGLIAG